MYVKVQTEIAALKKNTILHGTVQSSKLTQTSC